jgi:fatty acid desaturase
MDRDRRSLMIEMATLAVLAGVIFFLAWLAATGRVAYVLIMLWIAAGLAFAVLDLIGYELAKKQRRG